MKVPDDLDGPLRHLLRPTFPWRTPDSTECGRALNDVQAVITVDEARALIAKYGSTRARFLLCGTCSETCNRHPTWDASPSGLMHRLTERRWRGAASDNPTDRDLRAIAALVEAHRDEFDGYLAGLDETTSLTDARTRKAAAARYQAGWQKR
jgi:hypothetical protein